MKLLMKLFSVLLVACLVALIFTSSVFSSSNTPEILGRLSTLFTSNIIPVAIIAICCITMQKNEESILLRITVFYMLFSIVLSALMIFLPLQDINASLAKFVNTAYTFMVQTHLYLLAYALLSMIKPNNVICDAIKKIAYVAIVLNIIVQLWVIIKSQMIDTLPNVYGYQGFNFATLEETAEFSYKVVLISMYVEIVAIILTFITNYAFEEETIESENIDYEELKKEADYVVQSKIENIYAPKKENSLPDRSVSEKTGLMNINNQLGINSNVGQVNGNVVNNSTFVDVAIPLSKGPVLNNNLDNNTNNNNEANEKQNNIKN